MRFLAGWQQRARRLKREVAVLALAYRDPRVGWPARIVAACVVGYAFSPIDLIPDPIPILGQLDDAILVPAGIALAIKLIPPAVLADARAAVQRLEQEGRPANWRAAAVIVLIWVLLAVVSIDVVARIVS